MDNDNFNRMIDHLASFKRSWALQADLDDQFTDDNGDTVTVRDIVGYEDIDDPDGLSDIVGTYQCEVLDMPTGTTIAQACNEVRRVLWTEQVRSINETLADAINRRIFPDNGGAS